MADLNDIQLRIIVQGTGLDNLNRLNTALANATTGMGNVAGAAKGATSAWSNFRDELSKLEQKFDAVFRAASHLQALGSDLTGMGKATIGVLKESVDQWGEYEFAIHRAAGALSIFDTTSPIFFDLQKAVDEAAQEVRLFPAEEIAKAVYYWGSATGQTVETHEDLQLVMEGLIPIMQTAAITETDYEQAIKGTYQIIQQYRLGLTRQATAQDVAAGSAKKVGEEISNTADITQKLMMVTQNTAAEYSDLVEAFKYTGSIAPALGVGYEEILVTLGRLADLGIRGSSAGRALQQTFSKLVDPTVRASKALDEAWQNAYGLGKTFDSMVFPNGKFIGLTEYVDMLADVTEEMTEKERNNLVAIMTTQNELRTMIPLIEDQIRARKEGISVYDDEKFALQNAAEQFQKTTHLLEISWKGTLGYLQATIGPVVRLIGAEVARIATPFIERLGVMLKQVKLWLDTHPEIVEWGVRFAAIAGTILLVAGALFTAVGVLMAFGAGFAFVWQGAKIFFGVFNKFLPVVGLITAAVAGFIAIWTNNFGGIRTALEHVFEALGKIAGALNFKAGGGFGLLERLGTVILPLLEGVAEKIAWGLERLAEALEWIAGNDKAVAVLQFVLEALMALAAISFAAKMANVALSIVTLGGSARGALLPLKLLFDALSNLTSLQGLRHPVQAMKDVKAAIEIAADSAAKKGKAIRDAILGIGTAAGSAAGSVRTHLPGMAATVATAARGISLSIRGVLIATGIGAIIVALGLLWEAWENNWGDIQGKVAFVLDWISDRFTDFISTVTTIWNNVTTAIGDAVENIITFFRELPGRVMNFLNEVWTNITTWVSNIVTTIVEFPGKVWDAIVTGFENIKTFLGEWWDGLGTTTADKLGYIVGLIISFPIKVFIEIVKWFAEIWGFFVEWWEGLMADIGVWVTGVVTTILDWIGQLPGRIGEFFGQVKDNFVAWWNWAIFQLGRWAGNLVATVVDWVSKLPGRIADFFSQVWTNVSTWFTRLVRDAGTWASQMLNNIITWVQQLPGRVLSFFSTLWTNVSNWFTKQFIPNIGTWTMDAVNKAVKFFGELPGKVMDKVRELIPKMLTFLSTLPSKILSAVMDVGRKIVDGVWRGIQGMWNTITTNIKNFFEGIIRGVKENLGISSPSKVFMDIGKDMMKGLEIGIDHSKGAVAALESQVDTLLGTTTDLKTAISPLSADFGFEMNPGERKIVLEHRVSSPDGTVNSASREQLREIFTGEELVSALEHMATVQ
jgi:TP901 family phage tail tape measure protein